MRYNFFLIGEKFYLLSRKIYAIILFVVAVTTLHISRRVGMADDADSKSVGRKPVWVQVPPPALKNPVKSRVSEKMFDNS